MDVGAALLAYPQMAELVQPTQGPLYHPAVHSQPAAVFRAPPGPARCGAPAIPGDAAASHRPGRRTVALAGDGDVLVDSAPAARRPPELHIKQGQRLGYVVTIGAGQDG